MGAEASTIAQKYTPSFLNIYGNPFFDPSSGMAQGYLGQGAPTFYNQFMAPGIANMTADVNARGMAGNASGSAEIGAAPAAGHAAATLAGPQAYEALLGGMNTTLNDYYNGAGQMAYNSVNAANQFNSNIYGTQGSIYGSQLGAASSLGRGKGL